MERPPKLVVDTALNKSSEITDIKIVKQQRADSF
jgi:hypothetical protein